MKNKDNYFIFENVKKNWPDFSLAVSFCLEKEKMLCIAGQSGSGKSTILRMISGLIKTNSDAKIFLDGKEIQSLAPEKRNIGMVFQSPTLFPHMNIVENVSFGLRSKKIPKKEAYKKASLFLERFGLVGFEKRYPDSLSGGEAQRVALARTLIVEPLLVLFDEPFSSLDAPLRKKLALDIRESQKDLGFTGILVTHDIEEVKTMSDSVIVLNKGSIVWRGEGKDFTEDLLL